MSCPLKVNRIKMINLQFFSSLASSSTIFFQSRRCPISLTVTMQTQHTSHKVAVIGAGAAGLVAARELRREGHQVVAFERNNRVGGTWVYDPSIESDPLGLDPSRTIIHTSLYDSLRTNLPREVMGFRDFPFVAKQGDHRDPRRFPSHREVLHYLEDFATEFELRELIRFDTEVAHVGLIEQGKWVVRSKTRSGDVGDDDEEEEEEVYDAVVVCNGHYTKPYIADIPGIDVWPGKQIHSRNYRVPDPFYKKVVVLIGHSHSGYDISRDIAKVAKEVHVASKSTINANPMKQLGIDNLWLHSMVRSAHEDGTILFQDGSSVLADVVLHCTGYKYDFPFLKASEFVSVDDNRVSPLYQHIFPPQFAPWLSFVGLGLKILPFFLYELQSKWVAGVLSGRILLPSIEMMTSDVEDFYSKLEAAGVPKRYTHNIKDYQFDYYDWLAGQCGIPPFEKWRIQIYEATGKNRAARPETYRDEWEDQNLIVEAHEDFRQYMPLTDGENFNEFKQNC